MTFTVHGYTFVGDPAEETATLHTVVVDDTLAEVAADLPLGLITTVTPSAPLTGMLLGTSGEEWDVTPTGPTVTLDLTTPEGCYASLLRHLRQMEVVSGAAPAAFTSTLPADAVS